MWTRARRFDTAVWFGELTLAGDVTTAPHTHVAMFSGSTPCNAAGIPLTKIINGSGRRQLADDFTIDHTFSSKPLSGAYSDYYEQMTTYARILSGPAASIDPSATAMTFRIIEAEDDSPFAYRDTASSRSGIDLANSKLKLDKVAIVGVGGTGSYILDLVAKTPVREIHLFDGDFLFQHNAFRAPGAASRDDLAARQPKVTYLASQYSKLRRGIVPHPFFLADSNVEELKEMQFIFLAIDKGAPKRHIAAKLADWNVPFIDVGMGVDEDCGIVGGILRVTMVTPERPLDGNSQRIPFSDGDGNDDYSRNIQIAELNALNAALAVIKWKKHVGFYRDLEHEHSTTYTIDGNHLLNEDQA